MNTKKRFVTIKEYRKLKFILNRVLEHQDNIIKTIKTLTNFTPTTLEKVDPVNELVKFNEPGTKCTLTEKRKRRSSRHKNIPTLEEAKRFFHGKGYEIVDDGKKPIKIMKGPKKCFIINRHSTMIFKRVKDPDPKKRYVRVFIEDLV